MLMTRTRSTRTPVFLVGLSLLFSLLSPVPLTHLFGSSLSDAPLGGAPLAVGAAVALDGVRPAERDGGAAGGGAAT